jgi:hypothetical protein
MFRRGARTRACWEAELYVRGLEIKSVDSFHRGAQRLRRVRPIQSRAISWHTFGQFAPLPRVMLVVLYVGFLRRSSSPLASLRSLGQGRAETLLAFRRVITPFVIFPLFRCGVAVLVRQLRISRPLTIPCNVTPQHSFHDTLALVGQLHFLGASLIGGWTHPLLPVIGTTNLPIF